MSSLARYYSSDLVGFFSYSREDDQGFDDALSKFRDAIQRELSAQLGRNRANFRIWQDKIAIPHGALWQKQIIDGIKQSAFFVPIITPRAVNSPHCAFEFESFLARETELGRDDLVFPILYIPVPELDDETWRENPVLKIVMDRQYLDWREDRPRDLGEPEVRAKLIQFCKNIANAMRKSWLTPQERQQQKEAAARKETDEGQPHDDAGAQAGIETSRRQVEAGGAQRAAQEQAFAAAKRANTSMAIGQFLAISPDDDLAAEARRLQAALQARDDAYARAMASDDATVLTGFCATYKAGADVDAVRARIPNLDRPPRRRWAFAAGAIAAVLIGVIMYALSSMPLQSPHDPQASSPLGKTAAASPPTVSSSGNPPQAPSDPTSAQVSKAPVAPVDKWAACRPNAQPPTDNIGGPATPATLKLALTPAQQNAIAVRTIAVAPDGKFIVTAGDDAVVRVWQAEDLKFVDEMLGHRGPVFAAAFSSEGNYLATASFDGTVRLWDGHTFAHIYTFPSVDDKGPVRQLGVAFEPGSNPQYLDSTGADGNVWIWDLHRKVLAKKARSSTSSSDPATGSLGFVPNGHGAFASANFDGTVKFFLQDGPPELVNAFVGKALRLAYSRDGQLAVAGADALGKSPGVAGVKVWSSPHGFVKAIPAHRGHAASVAWSPDGTLLATVGGFLDPSVALWNPQSGAAVQSFRGHAADVEAVAFHPNKKWLLSGSEDGTLKIWDIAAGKDLLSVVGLPNREYVAYAPNNCYAASADAAAYVRFVYKEGKVERDATANYSNVRVPTTDVLLFR